MKSLKYKVDSFEPTVKQEQSTAILIDKNESVNKSYISTDDDLKSNDEAIDDITDTGEQIPVIMSSSSTSSTSELAQPVNSDSASSCESGFGTVDDEADAKPLNNQYTPLQQIQQQSLNQNSNILKEDKPFQQQPQQHQIRIPNIQGPRQIIYQLNNNNSDDVANILNDNSSINSSTSSSSNRFNTCCYSIMENLTKCYYSCFCCYSTTSNTNQTPFIWSWLSVFCCCCPILGCISLYLTNRSKKFKLKQKYDLAEKYSNYAEKLNIASLIFGVIFYAIVFFLICIFIFMHWRQTKL